MNELDALRAQLKVAQQLTSKLLAGLQHAYGGRSVGETPQQKRLRHIRALEAIGRFVSETLGGYTPLGKEIYDFAKALDDLDRGTVRDFLEPHTFGRKGRGPDPTGMWVERGNVCLAIRLLTASGMTFSGAIEYVENGPHVTNVQRLIQRHERRDGERKQTMLKDAVERWSGRFEKRRIGNPDALRLFEQSRALVEECIQATAPIHLPALADRLLSHVGHPRLT
jgi:hypothetical protein